MSRTIRPTVALLALAGWLAPAHAQRWQIQYNYDKSKSTFAITDLSFPSATRGVAVGSILEGRSRRPTAVVTADGGAHWQTVNLKEPPVSLCFLNETLGWMVTTKGLWQTTESGKSWRKVDGLPSEVIRVYFSDEKNGYAVGAKKKAFETHDGGAHWKAIAAADQLPGVDKYSAYTWIAFANPNYGIITGWNAPPRRVPQQFPDWMDPEGAVRRRDTPHLSYQLVTLDGGKTWKPSSASLFGDVTRVRFGPGGVALGLIEFSNAFRYPSEVYRIDWHNGKSDTLYRDRGFAVTDVWLSPSGTAWLAGAVVPGQIRNLVPGKVQVLKSRGSDLTIWVTTDMDYRAVANRVILSGVDDQNLWLATDNGMILKLAP